MAHVCKSLVLMTEYHTQLINSLVDLTQKQMQQHHIDNNQASPSRFGEELFCKNKKFMS